MRRRRLLLPRRLRRTRGRRCNLSRRSYLKLDPCIRKQTLRPALRLVLRPRLRRGRVSYCHSSLYGRSWVSATASRSRSAGCSLQTAALQIAVWQISLPYKLTARTDTMTSPLTSPSVPTRPASWPTAVLAGIVILIFFLCCVHTAKTDSVSWDESQHLYSGWLSWERGDFGYNPEVPP